MTETILLIADSTDLVPFADALSVRGFIARGLSLGALPPGLDFSDVHAIVLCDSTEPQPRAVTRLLQAVGTRPLPIIVALPEQHRSQRDSCLIAGAGDVAIGAHPDDVASRVDAAVHGWSRGSPRRKLRASLKAQRGRQMIDLQIIDIDPTGFGIVPVENVPSGGLLRTNLLLPDGEMLTWGRLATGDDGSAGVRFVALLPEERQRIVMAIKTKPTASTGTSPVLAAVPAAVAPEWTAPPGGVVVTSSGTPAPVTSVVAPGGAGAGSTSSANLIADAIGELLADSPARAVGEPAPANAESTGAPAGAEQAATSPVDTRKWPTVTYRLEASENVLAHACSVGLASDEEGAPSGERVLAFVRTLTTIERRAFDADPPPELPEPGLARKCLAMRLRLFALSQEANEIQLEAGSRVAFDDELLGQLNLETKGINGELQKVLDGFVATAQTQRIKEVNAFRNSLTRNASELRAAMARLRGEVADARSNAALLDIDQKNEGPQTHVRRDAPKDAEKKDEQEVYAPQTPARREARRRRRIVIWAVLLIVSAVALVFFRPQKNRLLTGEEFRGVADVNEVVYDPHRNHATVVVNAKWRADPTHLHQLEQFVGRQAFDSYVVVNDKHEAMALGHKNKPVTVIRAHAVPK